MPDRDEVSANPADPTPLSRSLAAVRAELGLPDPDALARLHDAWADIVGADVGAHSRIRSLRDGTLTVAADAPTWATPLRYQRSEIARRARDLCGELVREVHIVVAAPLQGRSRSASAPLVE